MESSTAAAHAGGAVEGEYEEVMGRLSSLITQKVRAHTRNRGNQWDLMDRYLQILELEEAIAWMKVIHVAGTKWKLVPRIREGELIPRTMPPTTTQRISRPSISTSPTFTTTPLSVAPRIVAAPRRPVREGADVGATRQLPINRTTTAAVPVRQ